jgi:hypothetical protein
MTALQKEPSDRFQLAEQMQSALKEAIDQFQPNQEHAAPIEAAEQVHDRKYLNAKPSFRKPGGNSEARISEPNVPKLGATLFNESKSSYKITFPTTRGVVERVAAIPSGRPIWELLDFLRDLRAHALGQSRSGASSEVLQVLWKDEPLDQNISLANQHVQPGDTLVIRSSAQNASRGRLSEARKTQAASKKRMEAIEIGILRRSRDSLESQRTPRLFLLGCLWAQAMCLCFIAISLMFFDPIASARIQAFQLFVLSPITAVVFILWFYRTRKRFDQLGIWNLRYHANWSIAAFFIPFVFLVMPARVALDMWSACRQSGSSTYVNLWWGTYMFCLLGSALGLILNSVPVEQAAAMSGMVSALLAIRLVQDVNLGQASSTSAQTS